MSLPTRRHTAPARLPDLLDWLEAPWPALLPFGPAQSFRVEDFTEDGKYLIRAELPGLDPEKDVEVTADAGTLTIHAERREETKEDRHSEFKYGSLTRSVPLPEGVDPGKITAKYDNGILEETDPIPEQPKAGRRRIAVQR
jgi:HSP20 family protein